VLPSGGVANRSAAGVDKIGCSARSFVGRSGGLKVGAAVGPGEWRRLSELALSSGHSRR